MKIVTEKDGEILLPRAPTAMRIEHGKAKGCLKLVAEWDTSPQEKKESPKENPF